MESIKLNSEMARLEGKTMHRAPLDKKVTFMKNKHGDYFDIEDTTGQGNHLHINASAILDFAPYKKGDIVALTEVLDDGTEAYMRDVVIGDVGVEKVQEISSDDVKKEDVKFTELLGCNYHPVCGCCEKIEYRREFRKVWQKIYGQTEYNWDSNCWVFKIEYK